MECLADQEGHLRVVTVWSAVEVLTASAKCDNVLVCIKVLELGECS